MRSFKESKLPARKFKESKKVIRLFSFIAINFSPDLGMTCIFSISGNSFSVRYGRIRCESYPEKLCIKTDKNGFSLLLFKLQDLCAGPKNFPVRWSWSLTLGSASENKYSPISLFFVCYYKYDTL